MTLDAPYPATWIVRRALDVYLAENGFSHEGYVAKWTDASIFGIPIVVPNTKKHQWAIRLHDLHHVATGYGTDHVGEGEISAWELRGGLASLGFYVGAIVAAGTALGFLLAPRRTSAAWRAAKSARSLFGPGTDYEALLDMTVGELRAHLGVAGGGVADCPRALHARAPA